MENEKIKLLWDRRNHEDNLIHTRIGWTIATQSFLLIALTNSADKQIGPIEFVGKWIPWVGFVSTAVMMISIVTGITTYHRIRDQLNKVPNEDSISMRRSAVNLTWFGFLPAIVTPGIFIILWFHVLIYG